MSKSYNLGQLKSAIENEMVKALNETHNKSKEKVQKDIDHYYDRGKPKLYERTGRLLNSLHDTGVVDKQFMLCMEYPEVSMYNRRKFLDRGYSSYYSPFEVLLATETGFAGHTLGYHGYWTRSLNDIEQIMNKVFGTHFR